MTPTPIKPSAEERARTLHRVITDDAAEMENNAGTLIAELTALIEKADASEVLNLLGAGTEKEETTGDSGNGEVPNLRESVRKHIDAIRDPTVRADAWKGYALAVHDALDRMKRQLDKEQRHAWKQTLAAALEALNAKLKGTP